MTHVAPAFVYRTVGADGIDTVRPLWKKLRAYHAPLLDDRPPFLFESRKQGILSKAAAGKLRIELVSLTEYATDIAYCISTVSEDGCGEIDSMLLKNSFEGLELAANLCAVR